MSERPIHVTRTFLPPLEEYTALLKSAWQSAQLTNNGPMALELEGRLEERLGVGRVFFTGNGTIAMQLALQALDIKGEVITTPYSYVATTTALLWEHCTPVFADIDPATFCIDPQRIEERITPRTTAILATHVYGLPCDVDAIAAIARRHGLKVIYDGAHAFGTTLNGRSVLHHGDLTTLSFHATKLYHTGEGGAIVAPDAALHRKLWLLRSFGHDRDDHFLPGINGKNSELHAALGLVNLRYLEAILARRREQWERYAELLAGAPVQFVRVPDGVGYNHAYFPVVFRSEAELQQVMDDLAAMQVFPRRYFYPSLTNLPYLDAAGACPHAERIAERVICLPLFHDLTGGEQERIAERVLESIAVRT